MRKSKSVDEFLGGLVGNASGVFRDRPAPLGERLVLAIINKDGLDGEGEQLQKAIEQSAQSRVLATLTCLGLKVPDCGINGYPIGTMGFLKVFNG